jgi:hypothetical protein
MNHDQGYLPSQRLLFNVFLGRTCKSLAAKWQLGELHRGPEALFSAAAARTTARWSSILNLSTHRCDLRQHFDLTINPV